MISWGARSEILLSRSRAVSSAGAVSSAAREHLEDLYNNHTPRAVGATAAVTRQQGTANSKGMTERSGGYCSPERWPQIAEATPAELPKPLGHVTTCAPRWCDFKIAAFPVCANRVRGFV